MTKSSPLGASDIGAQGTATMIVGEQETAAAAGSGDLLVLATPALIAVMEAAAVDAVKDRLSGSETSVGIAVTIQHLAATPIGETVTATAQLTAVDGRTLTFSVRGEDRNGLIGEGQHHRAVVDRQRFMSKIKEKIG